MSIIKKRLFSESELLHIKKTYIEKVILLEKKYLDTPTSEKFSDKDYNNSKIILQKVEKEIEQDKKLKEKLL